LGETSESEIQRALRFFDRPARDAMSIDHCGPDVGMTEQLLDRAEVIARLQKVRRIRMAESMGRDALRELRLSDCFIKRRLNVRLIKMIPPPLLPLRNERQRLLREKPLPDKLLRCLWILFFKLILEKHPGEPSCQVLVMKFFHRFYLGLQFRHEALRDGHGAAFTTAAGGGYFAR